MENILNLLDVLSKAELCNEPIKGSFKEGDSQITYNITPNSYEISICSCKEEKKGQSDEIISMVNDFKNKLDNLSNEVFTDACEAFDCMTNGKINQFNRDLDTCTNYDELKSGINTFKKAVNAVIGKRVASLNKMRMFIDEEALGAC